MPLKDLLKKKDKIENEGSGVTSHGESVAPVPEFRMIRSTTTGTETTIYAPGDPEGTPAPTLQTTPSEPSPKGKRFSRVRESFNKGAQSVSDDEREMASDSQGLRSPHRQSHRLSAALDKMHIRTRSHSRESSSSHLPTDMPAIDHSTVDLNVPAAQVEAVEAEWEHRATLLAEDANSRSGRSHTGASAGASGALAAAGSLGLVASGSGTAADPRPISGEDGDISIQEAIRLHEEGQLEASTRMFGALASPHGENNALAQVLFGLALRHGWGVTPDPTRAVQYLSKAASNSAAIESAALNAGIRGGGAAKGELVLAIYELGNSYRHGWGVERDMVAARTYFETAANLGDVDAMVEVAGLLERGEGGKKDKWKAAQYLRRAEAKGRKEVGNSWIWKDKYDPSKQG